ncbi:hypothetical protein AVEN_181554-1 [Araneus ventricosus]|uniref:Uncharacterized protein n=1 Tax=Araneus ventricosus TaxID=182803 RepID=A0A4Y2E5X5_ARAVE|nr:hypothetical protein AVEN_181554-1 [Araneus ventricosus]
MVPQQLDRTSSRVTVAGQPAEGCPDAMGEPDHGHPGVSRTGHRDAYLAAPAEEALRQDETPHLQDHDEEHPRTRHLSTDHHLYITLHRTQNLRHRLGHVRALAFSTYSALHHHLQHVRHDDPLQRDQRPKNPRREEHLRGPSHKPRLLQHTHNHRRLAGDYRPVRGPSIFDRPPLSGPVAVVLILRCRGTGVGPVYHHHPHEEDPQDVHVGFGQPRRPGRGWVPGGGHLQGVHISGSEEDGTDPLDQRTHASTNSGDWRGATRQIDTSSL